MLHYRFLEFILRYGLESDHYLLYSLDISSSKVHEVFQSLSVDIPFQFIDSYVKVNNVFFSHHRNCVRTFQKYLMTFQDHIIKQCAIRIELRLKEQSAVSVYTLFPRQ